LEHEFYDFPYIGNVIIPTDELIFFRGVGQPPTSYISHSDHGFFSLDGYGMDQLTTGFLLFSYQFIAGSEMDVHPYITTNRIFSVPVHSGFNQPFDGNIMRYVTIATGIYGDL
jgi:hypothetical protein